MCPFETFVQFFLGIMTIFGILCTWISLKDVPCTEPFDYSLYSAPNINNVPSKEENQEKHPMKLRGRNNKRHDSL